MYRAGTGAAHNVPDALSRNPPVRDELILARTGDWEYHRSVIRGVERAIKSGEFDDDEPPLPTSWEEALAETGHKPSEPGQSAGALARAPAAAAGDCGAGGGAVDAVKSSTERCRRCSDIGGCPCRVLGALSEGVLLKEDLVRALGEECLTAGDVKPVEMLFLGPFATSYEVDRQLGLWRKELGLQLGGVIIRAIACDPPFEVPGVLDSKGFWLRPIHPKADDRRKLLRKQLFASAVQALGS